MENNVEDVTVSVESQSADEGLTDIFEQMLAPWSDKVKITVIICVTIFASIAISAAAYVGSVRAAHPCVQATPEP